MGTAIPGQSREIQSYCGVRGYSDKGMTWVWPSWDSPGKVHRYCGVRGYSDKGVTWVYGCMAIRGQSWEGPQLLWCTGIGGDLVVWPSRDSPGKVHSYCGVQRYSDKGVTWVRPSWDSPGKVQSYCGVQGYSDKGVTWVYVHPGTVPGRSTVTVVYGNTLTKG